MLFRDQPQTQFPRRKLTEDQVEAARTRDKIIKESRTEEINDSKYKQATMLKVGDHVFIRNKRTSKFQPYFSPDDLTVIQILNNGTAVKVKRNEDGKIYIRHPNDLKLKINSATPHSAPSRYNHTSTSLVDKWREAVMSGRKSYNDSDHQRNVSESDSDLDTPATNEILPDLLREDAVIECEPPLTPQGRGRGQMNVTPLTPRGRGRGRGRRRELAPQLQSPTTPNQFNDDEMPVLTAVVRRSERVANKN